jgi:hypothetical protein
MVNEKVKRFIVGGCLADRGEHGQDGVAGREGTLLRKALEDLGEKVVVLLVGKEKLIGEHEA